MTESLAEVLVRDGVRAWYQPVVDLAADPWSFTGSDPGHLVGYEALARGPEGPLHAPGPLFAAARAQGLLTRLDEACRTAAFRGALRRNVGGPLALFVNVEPEALEASTDADLAAVAASAPPGLRIVLEFREAALVAHPARLLRTADRVRDLGWAVALDDVGVDALAPALLPLLAPDVVKLDPRHVRRPADAGTAEVMHAVNAYAERSGALLLAEGIEDLEQLRRALALGARLGQGFLFGHPEPDPVVPTAPRGLVLGLPLEAVRPPVTPWAALPAATVPRQAGRELLLQATRHLEREAATQGRGTVVAVSFQDARHLAGATADVYRDLAGTVGLVAALGVGVPDEPLTGVRGATFDADDPLRREWTLTVLGPHFASALIAREITVPGTPATGRRFEFALTYDRRTVVAATRSLVVRLAPGGPLGVREPTRRTPPPAPPAHRLPPGSEGLLEQAMSATTSGITIADARLPDMPLLYVNRAFEQLSGFTAAEVLGHNCRFLQSPETDRAAIARIRSALRRGEEAHEVLLNVRGPGQRPWWNDVRLSPIHEDGVLVRYVGVQTDVTRQVETERELRRERDRARSYTELVERHARTDQLTGLMNRRTLEAEIEVFLAAQPANRTATGLLFCDVDEFKLVNDTFGHVVGDDLLTEVGRRLVAAARPGDLVARFGGDEFVVVLPLLPADDADREAHLLAGSLREAVARPVDVGGTLHDLDVSIGVSVSPADGADFRSLLHRADGRMYIAKARSRARRDR